MRNKIKSTVLLVICFAVLHVTTVFAAPSDWAKKAVDSMTQYGLLEEGISDNYQKKMTRAEFTAILMNVYEEATQNKSIYERNVFSDLNQNQFQDKIEKAHFIGIVSGTSATTFGPDEYLTREQSAAIICRLVQSLYPDYQFESADISFHDEKQISSWAIDSVRKCVGSQFMVGLSANEFAPQMNLSREQGIVLLYQVVERLKVVENGSQSEKNLVQYFAGDEFVKHGNKVYFIAEEKNDGKLFELDTTNEANQPNQILTSTVYGIEIKDDYLYTIEALTEFPLSNAYIWFSYRCIS